MGPDADAGGLAPKTSVFQANAPIKTGPGLVYQTKS
jgi:hypothetical protein